MLLFSFPLFWANLHSIRPWLLLAILWAVWLFWKTTRQKILYVLFLCFLVFAITATSDPRFFWVESSYLPAIARFSHDATFLPFRLRAVIFNPAVIFVSILGRALSYFWLDQFLSLFGLGTLFLLVSKLKKGLQLSTFLPLFLGVLIGSLPPHPNPAGFYFFLLPLIYDLLEPENPLIFYIFLNFLWQAK